jgi:hypothetical protein
MKRDELGETIANTISTKYGGQIDLGSDLTVLINEIRTYEKRKIEAIDSKWLPIDKKEMILKALGI